MDTISAGVTVSAYLTAEGEFGNADLAQAVTEKIAYREGIGDTLAEGVARCHDELGVENWTMKGLEFAAHDGRVCHGQGLSYAVANLGADHRYASVLALEYMGDLPPEGLDGKAKHVVARENLMAFIDSGVVCSFSDAVDAIDKERYEQLLGAAFEDLMAVGARTVERERHFHNERGRDRSHDDALPYDLPGFEQALDEYYELRGWTQNGEVPEDAIESAPIG